MLSTNIRGGFTDFPNNMTTTQPATGLDKARQLLRELRTSFLIDLPDRLDEIESLTLNLEQDMNSSEESKPVYDELYGHVHSIKGGAGTHDVDVISLISHQFEDALVALNNTPNVTPSHIDTFLQYVDLIRQATELAKDESADFTNIKTTLEGIRTQLKQGRKLALIVEGSHFMSRLYQDSLRDLPLDIAVLEDGLIALGWLLREKYDLVIMGAETKSLNGTALLYALNAAGGINRDIKTIMVTSREKTQFAEGMQPDTLLTKNKSLASQLHATVTALFTP
jgi:HPt (histidine-containing phosphotransfer) domain-containing protein